MSQTQNRKNIYIYEDKFWISNKKWIEKAYRDLGEAVYYTIMKEKESYCKVSENGEMICPSDFNMDIHVSDASHAIKLLSIDMRLVIVTFIVKKGKSIEPIVYNIYIIEK